MAEPPTPVPSISPAEMQILVSRAGLVLNPGQVADLVLAWRQVAALIGIIPHARPLIDDLATTFRLPPPSLPADDSAQPDRKPKATEAAKASAPASGRSATATAAVMAKAVGRQKPSATAKPAAKSAAPPVKRAAAAKTPSGGASMSKTSGGRTGAAKPASAARPAKPASDRTSPSRTQAPRRR
jgi:hypothetical protein